MAEVSLKHAPCCFLFQGLEPVLAVNDPGEDGAR